MQVLKLYLTGANIANLLSTFAEVYIDLLPVCHYTASRVNERH